MKQVLSIGAAALVLVAVNAMAGDGEAAPNLKVDQPPGKMVTLKPGESFPHNVHVYCRGEGSPTIVLESGIGASALSWWPVQEALSRDHRTCSYDRAGYGWSAPGAASRTIDKLAGELHEALAGAGERPPFLLAGHSFGGMIAQYYAARFPGEVAGLVLIDSSHPQQPDMLDPSPSGGKVVNPVMHVADFDKAGMPQTPSEIASFLNTRRGAIFTQIDEIKSFGESAAMLRKERVPALPMIVITRGKRAWPAGEVGDAHEALWHDLQRDLLRLSPRSEQVIATRSGHDIPTEDPSLVATEVRRLAESLLEPDASSQR
jgi:pimeloyl-ACP methyl ester carboxylesterase